MKWLTKQKLYWILQMALVLGIGITIGWYARVILHEPPTNAPQSKPTSQILEKAMIIEGNSLKALNVDYYKGRTLGALGEAIIQCESNGDPSVCSYAGCEAGMGLFQLIPLTVKYCEEKMGREIDPFNADDNIACGMWLLENEGVIHWKQSEHCWSKL